MSRARSAQVHVVIISNPEGHTWAVGTPSQRGFTELGAHKAWELLRAKVPADWNIVTLEITPIDEVLPLYPSPGPRLLAAPEGS